MRKVLVMCIALVVCSGCLTDLTWISMGVDLLSDVVEAQQAPAYVDPTIHGGSGIRDYSQPSLVIQGGQVQQTTPGTYIPDPNRGGWVVQPGQNVNPLPDRRNQWTTDSRD